MEKITHIFTQYAWAGVALRVLVIIAVVVLCAKLIHLVCLRIVRAADAASKERGSLGEHEKRVATVVKLVDTALRVMLYGAALLMVLRELGLDITPLLTGAGIAGVALGFGAQSLVKDVISGLFLLIENQIRVGDVVKVNSSLSGTVERMELRVTALRDADGALHIIPNGEIKSVSNLTHDFSSAVVDIPIPYKADLKSLSAALEGVATGLGNDPGWRRELRSRPEFVGIVKFEPAYMTVRLSVQTPPHSRWPVLLELRRRSKLALEDANVTMLDRL